MDDLFCSALPLWSAVVLGTLVLLYTYLTWTFDAFKTFGINGPTPVPIFGNILPFIKKSTAEVDVEYRKTFGKVHGLFNARSPVLVVGEPDLVKDVLIKEFSSFANRTQFKSMQFKPLDRMMTVLRDDHWRHVRSSLSPSYSSGKLKQMLPTIKGCVNHLVTYIDEHSGAGVKIKDVISGYTMDVIAGTAFGLDTRSFEDPDNEFLKNARQIFSFANRRNLRKKVAFILTVAVPRLAAILSKLGFAIVDPEHVAYMEAVVKNALIKSVDTSEERQNFIRLCLHQLVDIKKVSADSIKAAPSGGYWTTQGLVEDDVVSNSIIFFVAGYETVSTFLSYFFYSMATNLAVQRRLHDEIAQYIGQGELTYEKLKDLRYLDMCMDEVLRMYPPALRIDRKCNKSLTIGRYYIPAGMTVNIPVYAIHHDSEYWDDPFTFNPERFTPEKKAARHPCVYLPFGAGPRNCIGMRLAQLEAKAAIANLLSQFEVGTCGDTPEPPPKFGPTFGLLTPEKPIVLTFKRRVSTADS